MRYWSLNVTSAPLSWMPVHAEPMRMRTNVVYFRVIRRLYRREWNWLMYEPASMITDKGSRRVTSYFYSALHCIFGKQFRFVYVCFVFVCVCVCAYVCLCLCVCQSVRLIRNMKSYCQSSASKSDTDNWLRRSALDFWSYASGQTPDAVTLASDLKGHRPRCIKFVFECKSEKSNTNWFLTNQNRA